MLEQPASVDQSDRWVPRNLRQTGDADMRMLMWNRVRKSPCWHLSLAAGCWRATVYNRTYHPFGYVRPQAGGPKVEYDALKTGVTLWNVAVERQIMVKGPDAEAFVDYVITRDATRIPPMRARYAILCTPAGGIINDPVLLRLSEDEFWFSLSDSDVGIYLQGVNHDGRFDVTIAELDVCPLQVQGPRSLALMQDLVAEQVAMDTMPYYGLAEAQIAGCDCTVSQTGFSGEAGYEIYLRDATRDADTLWHAVLAVGEAHGLRVTAPPHARRIQAGILSLGQDMDVETSPFQCNLGYQVSLSAKGTRKTAPYIGRDVLERTRERLAAGERPFPVYLVGLEFGGRPVEDFATDFWLVSRPGEAAPCGYVTSPWYHYERGVNIAMAYVPFDGEVDGNGLPTGRLGDRYLVHLPDAGTPVEAEVVAMPFTRSMHPSTRERLAGAPGT